MDYLNIKDKILMMVIKWLSCRRVCEAQEKDRIVVFRSAALGDFVISIPAFVLLREIFPDKRIVLVTTQSADKAQKEKVLGYTNETSRIPWVDLIRDSLIDEVIVLENLEYSFLRKQVKPLLGVNEVSACFLLTDPGAPKTGVLKKVLLFRLLGVKAPIHGWRDRATIEYRREAQRNAQLYKHHVLGSIESVLEASQTYGMDTVWVKFNLHINAEATAYAEQFWRQHHLENEKVIVVSPGAVQSHKKWPEENYRLLIGHLLENEHVVVILTGTRKDEEIKKAIIGKGMSGVIDMVGQTSVMQLAALLQRADLLVGNDGGTMHLGDAVGIPVISIVPGLEYPDSIEPWHNIGNSIRCQTECAPCYSFVECPLHDNVCMKNVTLNRVFDKLDDVLEGNSATRKYNSRCFKIVRNDSNVLFEEILAGESKC